MPIDDKLAQYGDAIVLMGFLIGITYIAGILPNSMDMFGLGTNVKYVYMGVIVIAAYTFYKFHKGHSSPSFQRSVAPRTLSNPAVMRDLRQQRSMGAPMPRRTIPTPPPGTNMQRPSQGIFDMFNKD